MLFPFTSYGTLIFESVTELLIWIVSWQQSDVMATMEVPHCVLLFQTHSTMCVVSSSDGQLTKKIN